MNNNNIIKILYVEDEKGTRDSLSEVLNNFCDTLYIACDGLEGLELYKQYTPDIIISDIKMPNMNGIDMVKAIKNINNEQHVIFTTSHTENDYFIKAIDASVDGYILKPIDLDKLENKINSIKDMIKLKLDYKQQQMQLLQHQSKLASLGEMIAIIAHQWRQPLSQLNFNNIYIKAQIEDNNLKKEIEKNNDIIQFMSDTIYNFENFYKKNDTKLFNIKDALQQAFILIESSILQNNITIHKNINQNITTYGLSNSLSQIILAIIQNMVNIIQQREIQKPQIWISLTSQKNHIIIEITDNAQGISIKPISDIFEPFKSEMQVSSTGIGLYMSKLIIEREFKGNINVINTDNGAKFILKFPLLKE